jgi:hypothetical protein
MSKRLSLSVMLLAASALGACVTPMPAHLALNAAEQNAITTTEIVAPVHQSEVYIYVPPSQMAASGQGGLIGVLVLSAIDAGVNNARTSSAEKAVKPVRDAVVDFDFDSMIRDVLRASISKVAWMHIDAARVVKDLNDTSLDEDITKSKDGAALRQFEIFRPAIIQRRTAKAPHAISGGAMTSATTSPHTPRRQRGRTAGT